jgi:hypothetical protein
MSAHASAGTVLGLRVADLQLWLDARQSGIQMQVPPCYTPFLVQCPIDGDLHLLVRSGSPGRRQGWRTLCTAPESWELWQDECGEYALISPEGARPRRAATFDAVFQRGEVVGVDAAYQGNASFPLWEMDMVLYANWLAETGDLILHAAGVELDGFAYCFVGQAGAGKSTLAAAFARMTSATILGEDNVVLRYLDGRFHIFGTPWHLDPARCSPRGAPLRRLYFLDREGDRGIRPCAEVDGIAWLLRTAFLPYYRSEAVVLILNNLAILAEHVPFFTLGYELGTGVLPLVGPA